MSMRRIVPAILLIAVLAIGGGFIANAAYQAGVNTAVTTAVANGGTVAPVVVPAYGYGYGGSFFGFGFGIFGLLFALFFVFIVFGLLRAIFFGGRRGWGPGGWGHGYWGGSGGWSGPGGSGGPGGPGSERQGYDRNPFHERFGPSFEEWHRRAHGPDSSSEPSPPNQPSNAS
jgi:hypothetical protein